MDRPQNSGEFRPSMILLSLLAVLCYVAGVVFIGLLILPDTEPSTATAASGYIGVALGPLFALAPLLLRRWRAALVMKLEHFQRPRWRYTAVATLTALIASLGYGSWYLARSGPSEALKEATAIAVEWHLKDYQSALKQFSGGQLVRGRDANVYTAYVYSLAAVHTSPQQHPNEQTTLAHSSGWGHSLTTRIIAHLGIANLGVTTFDDSVVKPHLDAADRLAHAVGHPLQSVAWQVRANAMLRLAQGPFDASKRNEFLMSAGRAYDELLLTIDRNKRPVEYHAIVQNRASVLYLRGQHVLALGEWQRLIAVLIQTKPDNMAALLGDLYNNCGVVYLHMKEWDLSVEEFRRALAYPAGDMRATKLNLVISLIRAGRREDAILIVEELEPLTERQADYVILGWAMGDNRALRLYARALGLSDIRVLTDSHVRDLYKMVSEAYLGLDWNEADFRLISSPAR